MMAIVLIEEVLAGLGEVQESLEQAMTTLANLIDDLSPDLAEGLKETIETRFLEPLQVRSAMLETLLAQIAAPSHSD